MKNTASGSDNQIFGYALSFVGFAAFSVMDVLSKRLGEAHSLPQILCLSGVFTLLFASLLAKPLGGVRVNSTRVLAIIVMRGLMSVAMTWLTLYAITLMPIANVYSIRFLSPAITVLLALAFLGERPLWLDWAGVALGLAGIALMLGPDGQVDGLAAAMAFGAAVAQSASIILVRHWKAYSTPLADTLIPIGILVTITGVMLPGRFIPPTPEEWLLYVAAGILLATGRLCLTLSIRHAPSSAIASVQYTQLLWGVLFGWLLFSDLPSLSILAGALLIVAGSVLGTLAIRRRAAA